MQEKKKLSYSDIKPYITVIIIALVALLLWLGVSEPTVTKNDEFINISCMMGMKIPLSEVQSITLLPETMSELGIGRRTFGFDGFGSALKGSFTSQALGAHHLYVYPSSSPTIKIVRKDGGDVYISFKASGKTEQLFVELTKE